MKEQLVSFKTAKLAKEKGFAQSADDYTLLTTVYELNGKLFNNGEIKISTNFSNSKTPFGQNTLKDIHASIFEMDNSLDKFILAPTQCLLQKWLREEQDLHLSVERRENNSYRLLYSFSIYNPRYTLAEYDFDNGFDTYEEALEVGLQEALKTIKKQIK